MKIEIEFNSSFHRFLFGEKEIEFFCCMKFFFFPYISRNATSHTTDLYLYFNNVLRLVRIFICHSPLCFSSSRFMSTWCASNRLKTNEKPFARILRYSGHKYDKIIENVKPYRTHDFIVAEEIWTDKKYFLVYPCS